MECAHERTCGACGLLGQAYGRQLARKRDVLAAALRGQPALRGLEPEPCLASPRVEGYRNRAKMAVAYRRDEGALVGYFRAGSRQVVDAPDCRVLEPELLQTTRGLRLWMNRWTKRDLPIRFVDVRCGSSPRAQILTLVLDSDEPVGLPVRDIRRACPHVAGIAFNLNPGRGAQVLKGRAHHAWGEGHVRVETPRATLLVSAGAFFQVNRFVLDALHARMEAHLGEGGSLVDLYAGVGTHGLALRRGFKRVLCVEGMSASVRDARAAIDLNAAAGVSALGSPVERALPKILAARPDAVILNPSKEGSRREVLEAIAASPARKLAYLSCEPVTLARDLAALVAGGFRVDAAVPVDMMPQTLQVEALALLSRESAPRPPARPARKQRS